MVAFAVILLAGILLPLNGQAFRAGASDDRVGAGLLSQEDIQISYIGDIYYYDDEGFVDDDDGDYDGYGPEYYYAYQHDDYYDDDPPSPSKMAACAVRI